MGSEGGKRRAKHGSAVLLLVCDLTVRPNCACRVWREPFGPIEAGLLADSLLRWRADAARQLLMGRSGRAMGFVRRAVRRSVRRSFRSSSKRRRTRRRSLWSSPRPVRLYSPRTYTLGVDRRPAIPVSLRRAVIRRDRSRCQSCGIGVMERLPAGHRQQLQIDHIYPWSHGGGHMASNLQVLCGPCNRRKSNKVLVTIPPHQSGMVLRPQGGTVRPRTRMPISVLVCAAILTVAWIVGFVRTAVLEVVAWWSG